MRQRQPVYRDQLKKLAGRVDGFAERLPTCFLGMRWAELLN